METFLNHSTIGIIGYGKFGMLIGSHLFPKNNLRIYSPHLSEKKLPPRAVSSNNLEDLIKKSNVIIPAVPIRYFASVIQNIAPYIEAHHIVMDICSVKEYPMKIMQQYLPKKTQIIGTHPMFGPISILNNHNSIKDLRIVLQNISTKPEIYQAIKYHFQSLGLDTIELSAMEHDELSAGSHFFSKIVKYMVTQLQLKKTVIDTTAADNIFDALENTDNDSVILEDMIKYNSFSQKMIERMIVSLTQLQKNQIV